MRLHLVSPLPSPDKTPLASIDTTTSHSLALAHQRVPRVVESHGRRYASNPYRVDDRNDLQLPFERESDD